MKQDFTEHEHSDRCRHGEPARFASSHGLPPKSLVARDDGSLAIDLNLMFKSLQDSSGSGGAYVHATPDLGRRIDNLAAFLLDEAGLTVAGAPQQSSTPWHLLKNMARRIHVAKPPESLEGRLLFPTSVYGTQAKGANFAKLARVANSAPSRARTILGRVLVVMLMPADARARSRGVELDHANVFGVYGLQLDADALKRAWARSSVAEKHHIAGNPVLAIGMATVRSRGSSWLDTAIEQLAVIPVDRQWTSIQHSSPTVCVPASA